MEFPQVNQYLEDKVNKLQRAQQALLATKDQLQRLLATSPSVIYSRRALDDFCITFISESIAQFGYTARQFLQDEGFWAQRIHPEDVFKVFTELLALFGQNHQVSEYRLLQANGNYCWIQDQRKLMRDEEGNPLEIIGSWQDITELKEMEQELFEEKELAQVTLQSIGEGIITTDASGMVKYLNPMAEKMTGWKNKDAVGLYLSHIFQTIVENTGEPTENIIKKVLLKNGTVSFHENTLLVSRKGERYSIDESAAPIRDRHGQLIGTVLIFRDVTQPRKLAQELSWQANHDTLTGLVNRRRFEEKVQEAIIDSQKEKQEHTLCYLDLDQFKIVNDTCGHVAGDELLRQLSLLLKEQIRGSDILARLGGDEFGVLLHQCPIETGLDIAEKIRIFVHNFRFVWENNTFSLGASIGLIEINSYTSDLNSLLSAADAACYAAKEAGRNRIHIYQSDDLELAKQREERQWVNRIHKALEENRFCLYRQAIVPLNKSDTSLHKFHYEILVRMKDEIGNIIPPMAFIPAAERYGLMPALDHWIVNSFFSNYHNLVGEDREAIYTINLSGATLTNEKFLHFLQQQFALSQIPPEMVCFEITETAAIANLSKAVHFINELKKIGCSFALDDFGSGMSSFAYLKNLPVDYLKIDGYFIKDITSDPIDCAMVDSINRIGHVMGIKTIAEFVENDQIIQMLQDLGVDYAQGYGIAKPRLFF